VRIPGCIRPMRLDCCRMQFIQVKGNALRFADREGKAFGQREGCKQNASDNNERRTRGCHRTSVIARGEAPNTTAAQVLALQHMRRGLDRSQRDLPRLRVRVRQRGQRLTQQAVGGLPGCSPCRSRNAVRPLMRRLVPHHSCAAVRWASRRMRRFEAHRDAFRCSCDKARATNWGCRPMLTNVDFKDSSPINSHRFAPHALSWDAVGQTAYPRRPAIPANSSRSKRGQDTQWSKIVHRVDYLWLESARSARRFARFAPETDARCASCGQRWEDPRIERCLVASGRQAVTLSESCRKHVVQALLAHTASASQRIES
jgi:hypothetical protein